MVRTKKDGLARFRTFALILIVGIAAALRLVLLDRIPTGILMDEFDNVLNAKFVYHTGANIRNNWSPLSLSTFPNEVPKGELTYLISLPFVGPFGLSLFTARIGFALISIATVLVLYGIAETLFGPWVALATAALTAINPWMIYFGRTAYDVPVSVTFYFLAFLLLLRLRGPKLLLSLFPFFFAFYNYIGMKLLLIPFAAISVLGSWLVYRKRQDSPWYLLVFLGTLVIIVSFIVRLPTMSSSLRTDQLFTPFDKTVTEMVNVNRRMTIPSPFTVLFSNKLIVYAKIVFEKYAGAFSPSILFTNGEGIATFALWEHGLFYPIDALFIAIGLLALFASGPALAAFLIALAAIAPLPSVLSTQGTTYVHRSSLMIPVLLIFAGYGIVFAVRHLKKHWRLWGSLALFIIYGILVSNFVDLYFFRFPYYNSEAFGVSQRIYSRYMALAAAHSIPVVNFTESPELYFRNYIFYGNVPNAKTIPSLRPLFDQGTYTWQQQTFTKQCPKTLDKNATYILSNFSPCKELFLKQPMIVIPSLSDGGTLYMAFNDRVCGQYALSGYPAGFMMRDFAIESIPEKQFCERFFIRYSDPLYRPQTREGSWIVQ